MLIKEHELQEWTGYQRRGDLERWCRENRIPVITGKNGTICTTSEAVNDALIGKSKGGEIEFS